MRKYQIEFPADAKLIFITKISVGIFHINYGEHLGHDSLIALLAEARVQFLQQHGIPNEMRIKPNIATAIVNLIVNYEGEAFHGDVLEFKLYCSNIRNCSLDYYCEVSNTTRNNPVAKASLTVAFIDLTKRKTTAIPSEFLQIIAHALD